MRYAVGDACWSIFFVFPVYWLFIISFKTPDEIFAFPPVWYPKSIQFANYAVLFKDGDAETVLEQPGPRRPSRTVIAMILGTIAAYSLVRFKTGGENLAVWIISQRMMPPVAIVFPVFLLYVYLGWVDTYHGLIILYTAFSLPYVIWMMRGYIEDIPLELEESALVDGCTPLAGAVEGGVPDGAHRPVRDGGVHLRLRLERLPVRLRADAHGGHHLHGAGHPLFRRPVEFLGQDRGHVGARHGAGLHHRRARCSAISCAASRWARCKG